MQQYVYCAIIDLSNPALTTTPGCDLYQIAWTSCCRNNANVNLQNAGGQSFVIRADINNADFPDNNTPLFTAQPIPYVCIFQSVNYNFGVVEPDGDSLAFFLDTALTTPVAGGGSPIPYAAGFSGAAPLPGIVLDPLTGQLTFTPTQFGNFTIVLKVCEYDNVTKQLKSCVFRDIPVMVQNCTGVPPNSLAGGIQTFTGSGQQIDSNSIGVCENQDFTISLIFEDADTNDQLSITSNVTAILPGSVFSTTGQNPITATVSWTGAQVNGGTFFTYNLFVTDDACPQNNIAFFTYDVTLTPPLDLGPDFSKCIDDTGSLNANIGSTFTWTVLSGDPINVGVNFGCDSCSNPWILPNTTTTYIVTNDLDSACKNMDTITIEVFDKFDVTIAPFGERCVTNLADTLFAVTPGGTWSGIGIDPVTGIFDPGLVNTPLGDVDTVVLIYDLMGNCPNSDTTVAIVHGQPNTTITSTGQFCVEDTIPITVQTPGGIFGGGPYINPGTGDFFATQVNAPDTVPITYTITTQFCTRTDTLQAEVIQLRNSTLDSLPQLCFGATNIVLLDSFINEPGGTWTGDSINTANNSFDPTGLPAGNYEIQYTFFGSCGSFTIDTLVIDSLPAVEILTDDTLFCDNQTDSVQLQTAFSGVWGGDGVSGASGFFIPAILGPGTYTITNQFFDPESRCFNADTAQIVVGETPPVPDIVTSTVCSGDDVTLFATGLLSNTYTWYDASDLDTAGVFGTGNPLFIPAIDSSTWFYVTQSSGLGCESEADSALVTVQQVPVVDFTATPLSGTAPLSVDFTNTTNPLTGLTFFWDFGDGNTSTALNPNNVYANLGIYTATLTADNGNCTASKSEVITVEGTFLVNIPNVFSPNGDGINDVFNPVVEGIDNYKLVIYNRWGKKVFETTDPAEGWDGGDLNDGTYYYVMQGTTNTLQSESVERTGDLTLLRQGQ
ncbi:MAG: gliding motility-associated C-terminal domain-containing protein [Bacteroidota bacterium]